MALSDLDKALVKQTTQACVGRRVDRLVQRRLDGLTKIAYILGATNVAVIIGLVVYVIRDIPTLAADEVIKRIESGNSYAGTVLNDLNAKVAEASVNAEVFKRTAEDAQSTDKRAREAIDQLKATNIEATRDAVLRLETILKGNGETRALVNLESRIDSANISKVLAKLIGNWEVVLQHDKTDALAFVANGKSESDSKFTLKTRSLVMLAASGLLTPLSDNAGNIEMYFFDAHGNKLSEAMWYRTKTAIGDHPFSLAGVAILEPGEHEVRIGVRGEANPGVSRWRFHSVRLELGVVSLPKPINEARTDDQKK